jgi:hypothetical protein
MAIIYGNLHQIAFGQQQDIYTMTSYYPNGFSNLYLVGKRTVNGWGFD